MRPDELSPENFYKVGLYKSPVFSAYFWSAWYNAEMGKRVGLDFRSSCYISLQGGYTFTAKSMVDSVDALIRARVEAGDFQYFTDVFQMGRAEFESAIKMFETSLQAATSEKEQLDIILNQAKKFLFFWFYGWQCGQLFGELIKQKASALGIEETEIVEYIPKLDTPLLRQQIDARQIKQVLVNDGIWDAIKNDSEKAIEVIRASSHWSRIDSHIREYAWITTINWVGEPLTLESFIQQLASLGSASDHKLLHSDALSKYVQTASELGYLNQAGAEYSSIFAYKARPYLTLMAERAGIRYEELVNLLPTEIYRGDEFAPDVKDKVIRRANDEWLIYPDEIGEAQIIDDPAVYAPLKEVFLPTTIENASEIRGKTGNKGKARGPVRVIFSSADFHKMQDGDVLVTPMTTPDFVLLMQRSAAIVTDMGGLLCHAVIVSRELGKPCVIATGNATQVLKDGDTVEVDASAGVVRKVQ